MTVNIIFYFSFNIEKLASSCYSMELIHSLGPKISAQTRLMTYNFSKIFVKY